MNLAVMAVFDKKARAFCAPFFVNHIDMAVRTFSQAANQPRTDVNTHPEDFALFHLGAFDDSNGLFALTAIPVHVVEGIALKKIAHLEKGNLDV